MPAPLELVISARADTDLVDIFRWSVAQFGEPVATDYLRAIDTAFALLCRHPLAGSRTRDSNAPERAYACRSHRIFYDVGEGKLTIVRVLHQAMLARLHFDRA